MLQNAYFLAKIGADTAENEQHVAEILPTDARGQRPPRRGGLGQGPRSSRPRRGRRQRRETPAAAAARGEKGRGTCVEIKSLGGVNM